MKNNRTAAQISIFGSSNLGDRYISASFSEHLRKCEYRLEKYDFLKGFKTADTLHAIPDQDLFFSEGGLKTRLKTFKCLYLLYTLLKARYENLRGKKAYRRLLKRVDIVFIGGGNLIMGLDLYFPLRLKFLVKEAKEKNKEVILWGVGAGPVLSTWAQRILITSLKDIKEIYCRDLFSSTFIRKELSFKGEVKEVPDPALIGKSNPTVKKRKFSETLVGISVSPIFHPLLSPSGSIGAYRSFINDYSKVLIRIFGRKDAYRLQLFSTERKDYFAVQAVAGHLQNEGIPTRIVQLSNLEELDHLMQQVAMVIGFRLHSLVIAAAYLKPCFGLVWQNKVASFFDTWLDNQDYYRINLSRNGMNVDFKDMEMHLTRFLESSTVNRFREERLAKLKTVWEHRYLQILKKWQNTA